MCREHQTKLNALMTSNCDLLYWLSFNIPNEWISCVCERLSGPVCVRAKDIECKQKHRRTIVQIKVVAFLSFVLGLLCYAMVRCAACFKNRMCNIRDRNHIVCIILILFCGSCCSQFKGCTLYVFVCLYFAIIDLYWIEWHWCDAMRCCVIAAAVFLFSGFQLLLLLLLLLLLHEIT